MTSGGKIWRLFISPPRNDSNVWPPRCEDGDPSLRRFPLPDREFLADVERRRPELLGAVLTIWRFGRQNAGRLTVGRAPGSYSAWARWCRDPLLTLGCRDPVERLEELAAADPYRQDERAIFTAWWEHHLSELVLAKDLHLQVKRLIRSRRRGPPDA
jgi:putative DNA primase/helicase